MLALPFEQRLRLFESGKQATCVLRIFAEPFDTCDQSFLSGDALAAQCDRFLQPELLAFQNDSIDDLANFARASLVKPSSFVVGREVADELVLRCDPFQTLYKLLVGHHERQLQRRPAAPPENVGSVQRGCQMSRAIAACDKACLHMSALAALVSAKISLDAAGRAFETDKSCRRSAKLTGGTCQSRVLFEPEMRRFGLVFHL